MGFVYKKLGKYLQETRVAKNVTQSDLGKRLGNVHSQYVSNWERGLCSPPNRSFQKVISILDLDNDKLCEVMLEDALVEIKKKVYSKRKPSSN